MQIQTITLRGNVIYTTYILHGALMPGQWNNSLHELACGVAVTIILCAHYIQYSSKVFAIIVLEH